MFIATVPMKFRAQHGAAAGELSREQWPEQQRTLAKV